VRVLADKNFELLKQDPGHPSLQFKAMSIGNSNALFKPDRPRVNPTPPLDPGPAHPSIA
jgi:hypothetical protein